MLAFRDNRVIIPALRDGAPTVGALNGLVMTGAGVYFTEVIDVGTLNELLGFLLTTAQGGTNPTFDLRLQYSADGKVFIDSGDAFSQITSTSNGVTFFKKFSSNFGKYIRFRIDIGGTSNPTYTVKFYLSVKDGGGGASANGGQQFTSSANTPAIIATSTALPANSSRKGWQIQNVGTNPLFILFGTGASSTVYHTVLKGGTGASDGLGGSTSQLSGVVYTGIITIAGTNPLYVVTELT